MEGRKNMKKNKLTVRKALEDLLEHYVALVKSGDAGFWNPEHEEVVMNAREVLQRRKRS